MELKSDGTFVALQTLPDKMGWKFIDGFRIFREKKGMNHLIMLHPQMLTLGEMNGLSIGEK